MTRVTNGWLIVLHASAQRERERVSMASMSVLCVLSVLSVLSVLVLMTECVVAPPPPATALCAGV